MSRLYDALTRRRAEGFGGDVVDALETVSSQLPPQPPAPMDVAGFESVEEALEAPPEPPRIETEPTHVALNQRARLLPFSIDPAVVEHYRRLRTQVRQQQSVRNFRTLVVTSANPQEGKSVTTLNLALSFGMLPSFRILVIDGDLRKGTLGTWLGIEGPHPGLSDIIDGSASVEEAVIRSDDVPVQFVLRGRSHIPAAELLNSPRLAGLMGRLGADYDLVLVDSPPINVVADAHLLVASCDAVLLVARAFSTSRKAFEKAAADLGSRVIGTVLNAGTIGRSRRYGYYY